MEWNKVWAIGRDTYLRVYPNPGVGICFGKYRLAVSLKGGIEVFQAHPKLVWKRTWDFLSRVRRP